MLLAVPQVCTFCTGARTDSSLSFAVGSVTIDLSKATKLRDVVFRPRWAGVEWITTAFETIPKHRELQKISIGFPQFITSFGLDIIERAPGYREWMDLDRRLVQFWESRPTGPKVISTAWVGPKEEVRGYAEFLLPELTRRGAIDLAE